MMPSGAGRRFGGLSSHSVSVLLLVTLHGSTSFVFVHTKCVGAPRCALRALLQCSCTLHATQGEDHYRCAARCAHTNTHIRCSNCTFRAALTMVSAMATVVLLAAKVNPLHRWLHHSIPLSHTLRNPPLDYTRTHCFSRTHAHTHTRCRHTHALHSAAFS